MEVTSVMVQEGLEESDPEVEVEVPGRLDLNCLINISVSDWTKGSCELCGEVHVPSNRPLTQVSAHG